MKFTKKQIIEGIISLLFLSIGIWNLNFFAPIAIIGMLYFIWTNTKKELSIGYISISFIIYIICGIISNNLSENSNANLHFSNTLICGILMLLVSMNNQKKVLPLIPLIYVYSNILWITIGFIFFGFHTYDIIQLFPYDLTNFKNLFNPFGMAANEWYSYLLLSLPVNIILHLKNTDNKILQIGTKIQSALIIIALILSFSRGIYLSLIIFTISITSLLMVNYSKIDKKRILKTSLFFIISCVVPLILFYKSIETTLAFNKTVSQSRSTQGRLDKWNSIDTLIENDWIWGVGTGNYSLIVNKIPVVNESAIFSSRLDNVFLTILVENGIIGLLTFSIFLLILFVILFMSLKKHSLDGEKYTQISILICGLLAFIVRELTFSSLHNTLVISTLVIIVSIIISSYETKKIILTNNFILKSSLSITMVTLVSFVIGMIAIEKSISKNNNKWIAQFNTGNYLNTDNYIDKALHSSNENFKLLKHKSLDILKDNFQLSNNLNIDNIITSLNINHSTIPESISILKKANESFPFDAEIYNNLAWLYLASNQKKSSELAIKKCLELEPKNLLFLTSQFLMNNDMNIREKVLSKILETYPLFFNSSLYRDISLKYPQLTYKCLSQTITNLTLSIENSNSPIAKAKLAILLLNDDLKASEKLLSEASNALPNMNRPWIFLADIKMRNNELEKSKLLLDRATKLDPNDYLNYYYKALYYNILGDEKKKITNYRKSINQFSNLAHPSYIKNLLMLQNIKSPKRTSLPLNLHYFLYDNRPLQPNINDQIKEFYSNQKDSFYLKKYEKTLDKLLHRNVISTSDKSIKRELALQ